MIVLSEKFLSVFQQVLRYIEKYYEPTKNDFYADRFMMLSDSDPFETDKYLSSEFIDIVIMDFKKRPKVSKEIKYKNDFCEKFVAYMDNDFEKLKNCCKRAHISEKGFKRICDGTFGPSKATLCNLIIAAELNFNEADALFRSANIHCYFENKFDVVISFFFKNEKYDFAMINTTLYLLDLPLLGYYYV